MGSRSKRIYWRWQFSLIGSKRRKSEKIRTFLYQKGISRTLLKGIKFHGGSIELNHKPARVIEKVDNGDLLTLFLPPEISTSMSHPQMSRLRFAMRMIIFAVNKPAYLATVPSHLYANDTLNRVKGYIKRQKYESLLPCSDTLDRDT